MSRADLKTIAFKSRTIHTLRPLANIKRENYTNMTAVIGILNKNGIAMAADSAVTVSGANKKKIYNTANKIFALSKYNPVGIMIYSSSSFMSVPWETIIKLYRKDLKDKYFATVEDYKNDFIKFLKDKDYYTSQEAQLLELKRFVYWNLGVLKDKIIESLSEGKEEEELAVEFKANILQNLNENIEAIKASNSVLVDFEDYTLERFVEYSKESIKEVIDIIFENIELSDEIETKIIEQYYYHLRTSHFLGAETGLVFGGFGENEIYPSVCSIKIAEVLDGRLRYHDDISNKISDTNSGSIMPFAQTDVIDMFIKGVDPEIDFTYLTVFHKLIGKYNDTLIELLKDYNSELVEKLRSIDITSITNEFRDELINVKKEKQIVPTVDTVAILSKEDLSEMAESLIYLTYLKRRISSDEESVGGPIDVAIISKGDGFIWKKRKHYFEEELNKHFMTNYFKK